MSIFGLGFQSRRTRGPSVPATPVLPVASVSVSPESAAEGNSGTNTRTVTVTLNIAAPAGGSSVAWAVTGVGANPVSASDFQGGVFPSGTITITAGNTTGTGTITIAGDTDVEPDETGRVTISSPTNCTLGVSAVDFTIENDDVSSLDYTVSVEDNGWVLAVRGTWGATTGAWRNSSDASFNWDQDRADAEWRASGVNQFPLDPNGTPKLVLSVQDAGYDRIGGVPVANANRPRTVVATRPLRRTYSENFVQPPLDETDHGDGTRTVRFALSEYIYDTTTIVSATFESGWKVGQGGGVINTVTNNSTQAVPPPMGKWLVAPSELVTGSTVEIDVGVASFFPEHVGSDLHQAAAGVRVTAYDGTNTPVQTWLSLRTSTKYGDSIRCWGGAVSLAGLNAGLVTLHYEIFPFVGQSRATGTAHSTARTQSINLGAFAVPMHVCYDPDSSRWVPRRRYVFVDTTSPNTTIASIGSVTLHTSIDDARAAATSTKPANLTVAIAKMRDAATTLAGANGTGATARNTDFWEILITDGQTIQPNSESVTSTSFGDGEGWLIIRGDPAAENPRATCALQKDNSTSARTIVHRYLWFKDMSLLLGQGTLFASAAGTPGIVLDNVAQAAKATFESGTTSIRAGSGQTAILNCTQRNYASQPGAALMRSVTRTGSIPGVNTAVNIHIPTASGGDFAPNRNAPIFGTVGNDFFAQDIRVPAWSSGSSASLFNLTQRTFGDTGAVERMAIVNVFVETNGGALLQVGETGIYPLRNCLFEGLTFAGGRFNLHNDADRASTTNTGAAVKVANTPNTQIIVGKMAHGLTSGDLITTTGGFAAAMNVANVPVTVLDANRFHYTASGAVTTASSSGTVQVEVMSGAQTGQIFTADRFNQNMAHTVIRNSALERNATKHDLFVGAPNLTGAWNILYGVGFWGNTNANRGTSTPANFQYAFYGIGSELATGASFADNTQTTVESWAVNWFGYVDPQNDFALPGATGGTLNGDYRAHTITAAPFKPSRLLNKGTRPANLDRDALGGTRGATFDGGALGRAS